jgi:hypothetical protein
MLAEYGESLTDIGHFRCLSPLGLADEDNRASCEARPKMLVDQLLLLAGDRGVAEQTSLCIAELGADAGSEVRNGRTNEVEDEQSEANDCRGKDDPVNGHGTGFFVQELSEHFHFWSLSWEISLYQPLRSGRVVAVNVRFHS